MLNSVSRDKNGKKEKVESVLQDFSSTIEDEEKKGKKDPKTFVLPPVRVLPMPSPSDLERIKRKNKMSPVKEKYAPQPRNTTRPLPVKKKKKKIQKQTSPIKGRHTNVYTPPPRNTTRPLPVLKHKHNKTLGFGELDKIHQIRSNTSFSTRKPLPQRKKISKPKKDGTGDKIWKIPKNEQPISPNSQNSENPTFYLEPTKPTLPSQSSKEARSNFLKILENDFLKGLNTRLSKKKIRTPESFIRSMRPPKKPSLPSNLREKGKVYKIEKKRNSLIEEFVSTEVEYLNHLKTLRRYYMKGLREMVKRNARVISEELHSQIFSEFDVLYRINKLFLKDIKKCGKLEENLIPFADVVCGFSQAFKLYSSYISKYYNIISLIGKEKKKNEKFKDFLEVIEKNFQKRSYRITRLQGYLILPIQRIPRYKILLENLLKEIEKVKNIYPREFKKLEEALEMIEKIARYLNEKQSEVVSQDKMNDLEKIINVKNFLQPGRKLLKEDEDVTCILQGKVKKMTVRICNIYMFTDMFLCLINIPKKAKKSKKFQTVALTLRPAMKIHVLNEDETCAILVNLSRESKEDTTDATVCINGMNLTIDGVNNFSLFLFFENGNHRDEWKDLFDERIKQLKESNFVPKNVVEKKKKFNILVSGSGSSLQNQLQTGFDILNE